MAFGYEVLISPLQTLTLYNAVANNGKMMKPYLVNAVQYAGGIEKQNQPVVLVDKICSDETLGELKICLEGVCVKGTARNTFKNCFYPVAGKTGTALVANGNRGYADHIYQSSFAGYFPADHPRYTCIVVIKNKPFAKKYLGAMVAGPVFREVADKLMSMEPLKQNSNQIEAYTWLLKKDSGAYYYSGATEEIKNVMNALQISYADSSRDKRWSGLYSEKEQPLVKAKNTEPHRVPDVKGMGLKDALYLLESARFQVITKGSGKVKQQSIPPGSLVSKNQKLILELN
jgi:cell division protein FtsI (penicillin-binding protein 3)